jgi:transcription factor C subunit 7
LSTSIHHGPGVAEWYSPATPGTGLHPRPGSAASLKEYISEIDPSWETVWYPSRKGETVEEIHNRIDGFLKLFVPAVEQKFHEQAARILIVSHAATTISLVMSLVGDRNFRFKVGCCSLSELKRRPGASNIVGGWEALKVADGKHLGAGPSREWGFKDIEVDEGRVGTHSYYAGNP